MSLTDSGVERFDPTQAPEWTSTRRSSSADPGPRSAPHPQDGGFDRLRVYEAKPAGPDHVPQDAPAAASEGTIKRGGKVLAIDNGTDGTVVIAGRLDAAQSPAAQAFLDKVQGTVTLDCSKLEYISSAGLGVLLKTQKRLLASGGQAPPRRRQPPLAGHLRLLGFRPALRDRAGRVGLGANFSAAAV